MPETEIIFSEEINTYILKIDGHEVATGELKLLANLAEELKAAKGVSSNGCDGV